MKKLILMLFTVILSQAFGQLSMPVQHDTTLINHEIIFSGDSEYFSTSLRKGLGARLIRGGEITNDIKDKSFNSHKDINKMGKDIQGEIEYRNYKVNLFGSEKWGFLVKGGYSFIGGGVYSKDLFGLAFYGNESYLDKQAYFSGTSANVIGFQKLGFGAINKKTKSSLSLNLINVSNVYSGKVNKGILDQTADSIDMQLDGFFSYTEKAQFSNGLGLAIDADIRIPIDWIKDQKAYIQVQVKNMGAAYMNQGMRTYKIDSTYQYSGFTFDQLFAEQSLFSKDFSVLDTLSIRSESQKKWVMLPGFIQAGKIIDENYTGKWQSFFGVRLYPTLVYTPLLYLGGNWRPVNWLDLGLSGSYGGFGTFRAGFYASFRYQMIHLGLGTDDVYGLVSKNAFGESFNLRLRCKF